MPMNRSLESSHIDFAQVDWSVTSSVRSSRLRVGGDRLSEMSTIQTTSGGSTFNIRQKLRLPQKLVKLDSQEQLCCGIGWHICGGMSDVLGLFRLNKNGIRGLLQSF